MRACTVSAFSRRTERRLCSSRAERGLGQRPDSNTAGFYSERAEAAFDNFIMWRSSSCPCSTLFRFKIRFVGKKKKRLEWLQLEVGDGDNNYHPMCTWRSPDNWGSVFHMLWFNPTVLSLGEESCCCYQTSVEDDPAVKWQLTWI